jgi:hypothetical protein
VIRKYTTQIFVTDIVKYDVIDKKEIFTPLQELNFELRCREFGFDFGELDVVMNGGTPIIIDVNNCVGGGHVPMLTGTKVFKEIDNTLLTFLYKRHANKSG